MLKLTLYDIIYFIRQRNNILGILFTFLAECTPCELGKYCEDPGLTAVQGDCDPGYLCIRGANTSKPEDGVTGKPCPQGQYCDGGLSVG